MVRTSRFPSWSAEQGTTRRVEPAPMAEAQTDLTRLFAWQMAAGLRRGDFSASELLEAHLQLIERQDRALHAWVSRDFETARQRARAADDRFTTARAGGNGARGATAAKEDGALHPLLGIPVALKDLVVTKGRPSSAGS